MAEEQSRSSYVKWAILFSVGLLAVTILVSVWLAFTAKVPTDVTVDPETRATVIEGPESAFTGFVTGSYNGREFRISGLPSTKVFTEDRALRRDFCGFRTAPETDWGNAKAMLRSHLMGEKMNVLCAPYE